MPFCVAKYLSIQKVEYMLLPDNIHPEQSVYYNGAIVLQLLKASQKMPWLDLYLQVNVSHKMSISLFTLCLDWLFLVEMAQLDSNGEVGLCS